MHPTFTKTPNKECHKEMAAEQCNVRLGDIDYEQGPHVIHISGNRAFCGLRMGLGKY